MKAVIIIVAALAVFWIVFFVAPGIVAYFTVFSRRKTASFEEVAATEYFKPYIGAIGAAKKRLESLGGKKVRIKGYKDTELEGLFIDGGAKRTAIFFHGYHSDPFINFGVQATRLYDEGFNLLFPVQRGHGDSGGKSTLGVYEQYDLLDWIEWVKANTSTDEVLVYGMSMGCTAAEYASDRFDPEFVKGAVYDCGYSSVFSQLCYDMKKRHVPSASVIVWTRAVAKFLLHSDIKKNVSSALSASRVPALFFHGTDDRTVPFSDGVANYEACASEKTMFTAEKAHHTVSYLVGGKEADGVLMNFINAHFSRERK